MNKICRSFWRFCPAKKIVLDAKNELKNAVGARNLIKVHSRCGTKQVCDNRYCSTAPQSQQLQVSDNEGVDLGKQCSDVATLTGGDLNLEKKLKIIFLEVDVLRQEGVKVPENVSTKQWNELLGMPTRSSRLKYLKYLWTTELKQLNRLKKKFIKRQEIAERMQQNEQDDNPHIEYGLCKNTLFLRVYDTTINRFYNSRLVTAMMFGQKLVLDCSYDSNMVKREAQNCAKQLMLLFADNRLHDDPFDLYLCNINREGDTMQELHKFIQPMYEDHFPLNLTEKSYLDIFPKEKIVYLTPHCREELTNFDHDAVYVIGALVDKSSLGPVSLAKAKREGIKMAKLPLDRYLSWGAGSGKSLTINQMLQILLEIKKSGDWKKALSYVPKRKLITATERETAFLRRRNNYEYIRNTRPETHFKKV